MCLEQITVENVCSLHVYEGLQTNLPPSAGVALKQQRECSAIASEFCLPSF